MGTQKTTYIYALQDPDTNEVRYIGKSNNPQQRFGRHMNGNINARKTEWVSTLQAKGKRPNLVILDEVENKREAYRAAENSWISFFFGVGNNLLNWIHKGYSRRDMLNQ